MANCGCSIKKPFVSVCVLEGGPPVPDSFDHKIRLSKYCLTAPPATARPTTAALTRTEPSTRLAAPRRDSHHSRTSLGYRSFSPLAPCDRTFRLQARHLQRHPEEQKLHRPPKPQRGGSFPRSGIPFLAALTLARNIATSAHAPDTCQVEKASRPNTPRPPKDQQSLERLRVGEERLHR